MREAGSSRWINRIGLGSRIERVGRWWGDVRDFVHGLWIARVSLTGVLAGFLLFFLARQAQDLFLEVRDGPLLTLGYWGLFYVVVLAGWVFPVYLSARWILARAEIINLTQPKLEPPQDWVRRSVPPFLAALCLAVMMVGQVRAIANAPVIVDVTVAEARERSINTQIEQACPDFNANSAPSLVTEFFTKCQIGDLVMGASRATGFALGQAFGADNSILVLYGLSAYLIFWLYLRRPFRAVQRRWLRIALMVVWWVFTIFVAIPILLFTALFIFGFVDNELAQPYGLWHLALLPIVSLSLGFLVWKGLCPSQGSDATRVGQAIMSWMSRHQLRASEWSVTARLVNPLFLGLTLVASLVLLALFLFVHPIDASKHVLVMRRALLIPLFLGMVVAPLTYFSQWSLRSRAPLILTGLALIIVIGEAVIDPHRLRSVPATDARQTFDDSVKRWAKANECDLAAPESCPSPIVMAAAGGASRAALHLAGITGVLLDAEPLPIVLSGDTGGVRWIEFSADGQRVLTHAWDKDTAWLWNGQNGTLVKPLKNSRQISIARFSADGRKILTGDFGARLTIWDGLSGARLIEMNVDQILFDPALSSDLRRIVLPGKDGVDVWDGETGTRVAVLSHGASINYFYLSQDGARVLTTADDGKARVWSAETGVRLAELDHGSETVHKAALSPSLHRAVTISDDANFQKTARLWDVDQAREIRTLMREAWFDDPVLSPDGRRVLLYREDVLHAFDLETGAQIFIVEDLKSIFSVIFSPDGRRLLVMSGSGAALRDAETGRLIAELQVEGAIYTAEFSPDGRRIAGKGSGRVVLFDGETGAAIGDLVHDAAIMKVSFSPDSRFVATASEDNTAKLWDAERGTKIRDLQHQANVADAVFSPDGALLMTRTSDAARFWDGRTGEQKLYGKSRVLRPFAKQLFALSAVSGGSLGAVTLYAALADAQKRSGQPSQRASLVKVHQPRPPCQAGYHDLDWFKTQDPENPARPHDPLPKPNESWRDCLQLILSGDFLSPVFVTMMSGDILEVSPDDRAVVLEEAWEARYADVTGQKEEPRRRGLSADQNGGKSLSTLARPMLSVRSEVLAAGPDNWLPILLLNGTSVQTGRRIIASDVETRGLFRDAYDLTEILDAAGEPGRDEAKPERHDIRLSTAATVSARFPVISPHGNIVRPSDGTVVDRVVDGGYYENFGASTALEVVEELTRTYKLKPFVILVNNDPGVPGIDCGIDRKVPDPPSPDQIAFSTLGSPLDALFNTRSARGSHSAAQLCSLVGADRFAFVTVRQQSSLTTKELSMSWWLSKYVQRYLDRELTEGPNYRALQKILDNRSVVR